MPKLKKIATTVNYSTASKGSFFAGEKNDCAVIAVTIATGKSYEEVHALMQALGRESGKGTPVPIIEKTILALGFRFKRWGYNARRAMMKSYPGIHGSDRGCRNITTHHPRRFRDAWREHDAKNMLFLTPKHILAVTNGCVHDWSVNNSLKVIEVYEVEPA